MRKRTMESRIDEKYRKPPGKRPSAWKRAIILLVALCIGLFFFYRRSSENNSFGLEQDEDNQLEVKVSNGTLEGFNCGPDVRCFFGIPFAQPPIGPLRFQHPLPPKKYPNKRLRARERPASCSQFEDCLYLNIIAPKIKDASSLLPVLIYVHGGAYLGGSADTEFSNIANRGIVVVSIQYRLGVYGFFTSGTEDFPANCAMFDQIAAMRWVQAEIRHFGGDPDKVTLSGQSAGGFSVSLHTFSPISQPLFQQAIFVSGTGFCPWAYYGAQNQRPEVSKAVAVASGCISAKNWDAGSFANMKTCIQKLDQRKISEIANLEVREIWPAPWNPTTFGMNWAPHLNSPDGFLPSKNLESLNSKRKKNMPVLLGVTKDEMFNWCIRGPEEVFTAEGFKKTVANYGSEKIWGKKLAPAVQSLLLESYKPSEGDYVAAILTSDRDFNSGTIKEAKLLTEITSNIYAYSFDFHSEKPSSQNFKGVGHAEDLNYLISSKLSREAGDVQEEMWKIWSNFVKTGNPNTPQSLQENWPKFTTNSGEFYSIGGEKPHSRKHYQKRADEIWNSKIPNL